MSDAQDKEWFLESCREAALFPKNIVYHDTYQHNLNAYVRHLDQRERGGGELFCNDVNSVLDLWEYNEKLESK